MEDKNPFEKKKPFEKKTLLKPHFFFKKKTCDKKKKPSKSRRGFTRQPKNSKRAHLRGPSRGEKKNEILGGPADGGSGGGGVWGSAHIFDAPTKILKSHRTDTPHHTTPHHTTTQHNTTQQQRHTTQHNGGITGWSWARGVPRREVHATNCPEEQPYWPRFLLSRILGQKWCGPRWSEKPTNMKKKIQKIPLPFTQNKK